MRDELKKWWLDFAEVFDSLRVWPRLIIVAYMAMLGWVTVFFSLHYFALPPVERGAAVTAFASVVLTAAYGAFPFIVKIYMDNGRDWDAKHNGPPQA